MLPGGLKDRSARQDGYFEKAYGRVFEGEAYSDPIKMRRQYRIKEAQKNIGKPFMPSSGDKLPSGLGSHYGTIGGNVPFFSAASKSAGPKAAENKNFYTNPGKKGTGFGYLQVTLGKYPAHQTEPYDQVHETDKKLLEQHRAGMKGGAFKLNMHPRDFFNANPYTNDRPLPPVKKDAPEKPIASPFKPSHPGKLLGGLKAGTFDPYPSHSSDPYGVRYKRPVHVVNSSGKTFVPSAGPKTTPVTSVINQNVVRAVNATNFRTVRSVTVH